MKASSTHPGKLAEVLKVIKAFNSQIQKNNTTIIYVYLLRIVTIFRMSNLPDAIQTSSSPRKF
ncbi:hypothetical protein I8748_04375 [Nostoc sp. CENA67]|uniref:Uncharacterized protein n=1 Tax=Amazonocrinis nigriterrae CENA67 TaxID=2794033 RepID=A0A8J7L7W2_9NOST|nr:hypothetical protein [Amazonocrinis nigriterrae]MBH8561421.1 hypothetical protein [Amazonocrinis nigriterrae CENA67]